MDRLGRNDNHERDVAATCKKRNAFYTLYCHTHFSSTMHGHLGGQLFMYFIPCYTELWSWKQPQIRTPRGSDYVAFYILLTPCRRLLTCNIVPKVRIAHAIPRILVMPAIISSSAPFLCTASKNVKDKIAKAINGPKYPVPHAEFTGEQDG